jgi:hypothetical protein
MFGYLVLEIIKRGFEQRACSDDPIIALLREGEGIGNTGSETVNRHFQYGEPRVF